MKTTINNTWCAGNKIRFFAVLSVFIFCFLFTYLNRNAATQGGALKYHIQLMEYYSGLEGSEYALYPLWGYPLVLLATGNDAIILYIQAFFGAIAASVLYLYIYSILSTNKCKLLWSLVLPTAIPYYAIVSVKWPASFQVVFIVLGVSILLIALHKNKLLLSVISGVLFGIACNFRSEYLYLSIFILVTFLIAKLLLPNNLSWKSIKHIMAFAVFTWLTMIPLGIERKIQTGTFNIKVGNGDWTNIYFSVGQYPNNSLGLRFSDSWIENNLRANLTEPYDSTKVLHMQIVANEYSKNAMLEYIFNNPLNFFGKLLHNFRSIVTGGFYFGQIEATSSELASRVILAKEMYKEIAGISNSISNLRNLYEMGLVASPDEVTVADFVSSSSFIAIPFMAIGAIYAIINMLMYVTIVIRVWYLYKKRITATYNDVILVSCILYGNLLMTLGMYENRFSSIYYLFAIAFMVLSIEKLAGWRQQMRIREKTKYIK